MYRGLQFKSDQNGIESFDSRDDFSENSDCSNQTKMGLKVKLLNVRKIKEDCSNQTKMGLKVILSDEPVPAHEVFKSDQNGIERVTAKSEQLQKALFKSDQNGIESWFTNLRILRAECSSNQTKMGLKEVLKITNYSLFSRSNQTKMGLKVGVVKDASSGQILFKSDQNGIER